ncbi:MAG TPA: phosphoglycerate mutase family protein [Acidimicrobiales bacterium]|nr:phosphoglycerate mutase family protein [Acidimicrobiales bacterium]
MTPPRRSSSPAAGHRVTPTLYLVRHGRAESRERWQEPDSLRPLTRRGLEQARIIAGHLLELVDRRPSRVLSSPAVRCCQTVEPLASASQLEVVQADWLAEGSEPDYAYDKLRKLAARLDPPSGLGGPVAACTHGDVIWGILERLRRHGVDLGPQPDAPKGGVWIIALSARLGSASLYLPDFYLPVGARKART